MVSWRASTWQDLVFAKLPAPEQAREKSFFHPMLRGFFSSYSDPKPEHDRIGITADSLPLPEGKSVEDIFPAIVPSDPRMILPMRKASIQGDSIHVQCPGCKTWKQPYTLLDVRSYPIMAEHPLMSTTEWEVVTIPGVTVMNNELTVRDEFGDIVGSEITKVVDLKTRRRAIAGYEPIELLPLIQKDTEVRAGFVCTTCTWQWIRIGYKVGGILYTKLQHIIMQGAPQGFIDEKSGQPGWNTRGLEPY